MTAPIPQYSSGCATSLTERLIQAAVDYESGRCSRRELSEARAAVEAAIVSQPVRLVTDWEDVEQATNVGAWCEACQSTHWSGQCDPDVDEQRMPR